MAEFTAQTHSHLGTGCGIEGTEKGKGRLAKECVVTIHAAICLGEEAICTKNVYRRTD